MMLLIVAVVVVGVVAVGALVAAQTAQLGGRLGRLRHIISEGEGFTRADTSANRGKCGLGERK